MAYGITKERKQQIGLESTAGTAVPATAVWRGPVGTIIDPTELVIPEENVGYAATEDRGYLPQLAATYEQPENEMTFEQSPVLFSACVDDIVAGSANGGTTGGYIYAYPVPATAAAAGHKAYTIEVGNNNAAYEMEYSFVETMSLKGASNQALTQSATWRGRQKSSASFTGALTAPTVNEILFNNAKLYYDAFGGTIGTTQKTGTWLGFTLDIESGWKAIFTGDGNLYFANTVFKGAKITGTITVEDETFAGVIRAAQAAKTTGLMRFEFLGPTLGGTGGTYPNYLLRVDMGVKWMNTPENEIQDDDDVITFPFTVVRSSTYCTFTFVNKVATISS